jgi:hypothetical protein
MVDNDLEVMLYTTIQDWAKENGVNTSQQMEDRMIDAYIDSLEDSDYYILNEEPSYWVNDFKEFLNTIFKE